MKLTKLADGRFCKNIGFTEDEQRNRKQPKFYLGREEVTAMIRARQLEQFWAYVSEVTRGKGEAAERWKPYWGNESIDVAHAIASGTPTPAARDAICWWRWVIKEGFFPGEPPSRKIGEPRVGVVPPLDLSQTLHLAMRDYITNIQQKYPTQWGGVKVRMTEFLIEHSEISPLGKLGTNEIEAVVERVVTRPASKKTVEPISVAWAKNVIKEFRAFLRWLNKSKTWTWTRPSDYDVVPVRISRTQDERAKLTAIAVQTFTVNELATLWKYALPFERLLLSLGLNCGFGMAEIASLQTQEVLFDQPHPYGAVIGLEESDKPANWVRRLRGKSEVYGEWKLWTATVRGLRWIGQNRPHDQLVVTTKTGGTFANPTHRNNQIANTWNRLIERVRDDQPKFPRRSFGKLRKTAINLVRQAAGEEVASVFASHGQPVHDELIRVYANPRWAALHAATDQIGQQLATVFDSVKAPFAPGETKGGSNISLGTITEIQRLAAEGRKPGEIGKRVKVSRETARRWAKRRPATAAT